MSSSILGTILVLTTLAGLGIWFYQRSQRTELSAISIFVALIALSFGLECIYLRKTPSEVFPEWVNHISIALFAVAVLELIFHFSSITSLKDTYKESNEEVKRLWDSSLSSLFRVNAPALITFFKNFTERQYLLKVALAANSDPERGALMYKHLIAPYFNRRFRDSFQYNVTIGPLTKHPRIMSLFTEFLGEQRFVADNYDLISEAFSSSSQQGLSNSDKPKGRLEIHLDFTRVQLEESFRSGDVFLLN